VLAIEDVMALVEGVARHLFDKVHLKTVAPPENSLSFVPASHNSTSGTATKTYFFYQPLTHPFFNP
jgi:hypothetical protein